MFTQDPVSCVTCHVSPVTCHVSPVTCQMSHVKKNFIFIFFLSYIFFKLSGGASLWRVCYQRGLPRLVLSCQAQEIQTHLFWEYTSQTLLHECLFRSSAHLGCNFFYRQVSLGPVAGNNNRSTCMDLFILIFKLMKKYEATFFNIHRGAKSFVLKVQMGPCSPGINMSYFHTEKQKSLLLSCHH